MYIIVDIDDTISRVGDRMKYAELTTPDWYNFHIRCGDDEPIAHNIDLVKRLSLFYDIIFLTMRPESVRGQTTQWLKHHGLVFDKILMRPDDCYLPAEVFKSNELKRMGLIPENVLIVIDDDMRVLLALFADGFTCHLSTVVYNGD